MAGLIDPGHVRVVRGTGAQHGAHGQASLQLHVLRSPDTGRMAPPCMRAMATAVWMVTIHSGVCDYTYV